MKKKRKKKKKKERNPLVKGWDIPISRKTPFQKASRGHRFCQQTFKVPGAPPGWLAPLEKKPPSENPALGGRGKKLLPRFSLEERGSVKKTFFGPTLPHSSGKRSFGQGGGLKDWGETLKA